MLIMYYGCYELLSNCYSSSAWLCYWHKFCGSN